MSVDPFLEALTAELEAAGLTVYDSGQVPPEHDGNGPYCVIHAGIGFNSQVTYDGSHRLLTYDFQVNSIGLTPEQARWAARQANRALLDKRLKVEGFSTSLIVHPVSQPVGKDIEPASRPVYIGFDKYKFTAYPKKKESKDNGEKK